jgi:N-carbamoylputrescine amidase
LIRAAAAQGANLVLCPELFMMPYFCLDQNVQHLELAETFAGNRRIARFTELAGELGIVLPIGFFERAGNAAYNSIAVADADGTVLGVYRQTYMCGSTAWSFRRPRSTRTTRMHLIAVDSNPIRRVV